VLFSVKDQRWKIADFGLAEQGTSKALIPTGNARGKESYRAPELVQVDTAKFSNKSDIWALGCILHELITGVKAFPSDAAVYHYSLVQTPLPIGNHPRSQFLSVFRIPALFSVDPACRPSASRFKLLNILTQFLQEYNISTEDRFIVFTSLERSILGGRLDVLRTLLDERSVRGYVRTQSWPLSRAIQETVLQQAEVVKALSAVGANGGDFLLPLIARKRYSEIRKLFRSGVTPDGTIVDEGWALLAAAASDDIDAVMTLLAAGCKLGSLSTNSQLWLTVTKHRTCEIGEMVHRVVQKARIPI
jgi:serine/threonine protein kinase